jgi:hypothetical protein
MKCSYYFTIFSLAILSVCTIGCRKNKKFKNPKEYTKYMSGMRKWSIIGNDSYFGIQFDTGDFEILIISDSVVYDGLPITPSFYSNLYYQSHNTNEKYTFFSNKHDSSHLMELRYYYEQNKIVMDRHSVNTVTQSHSIWTSM